jgi:hypothetical protein
MSLVSGETNLTYSELYFTSDQFDSGTNNNPSYLLTHQIQDVKKIKVSSVSVPFSYYIVNANTQVFTFEEAAGGPVSFNITNGNYNSTTFPAQLKSQLEANSNGTETYTVTISASTNKLTIASTAVFEIDIASSSSITGFTTATSSATTHTADNVINLSGTSNLFLRSNLANFLQRDSIVENNNTYNNVLKQIPINANSGDIIFKEFSDTDYLEISADVSDITFSFTDDSNNTIDFNGFPFSVTIQIFKQRTVL